ncbi:MAG: twin-arginine translocase TatA/TatE family subunit [Planctomycetes bacterium]|nr:twin-arginine translocase TatA/TatE family subunit [Planctomycetota bacterium]
MFGLGTTELIIIMVIILLLFGATAIPKIARGLGQGISEFKKGVREGDNTNNTKDQNQTPDAK